MSGAAEGVHLAGDADADPVAPVVRRVRLAAAMRAAWLHHLWSSDPSGDDPLTQIVENPDRAADEMAWRQTAPEIAGLRRALGEIEAVLAAQNGRLAHLEEVFRLDATARDLVHLALARAVDADLGRILAHLGGEAGRDAVTGRLAARIFGTAGPSAWRPVGPLARWRIATCDGDARDGAIRLDEAIIDWLTGGALEDLALTGLAGGVRPVEPLADWPVARVASQARALLEGDGLAPVEVVLRGVEGAGRASFAGAVARALGLTVFAVDLTGLTGAEREEAVLRGHRQAFLARAAVAWRGLNGASPRLPGDLAPFPLVFLIAGPDEALPGPRGVARVEARLGAPDRAERERLWRLYSPEAAAWEPRSLDWLASGFPAAPGRIAAAAAMQPASAEQAAACLRAGEAERLGRLARRIESDFAREDLILPERVGAQLDTLIHEARHRLAFWDRPAARRLFPQGRGLIALFTGPPGTGKTMAAQVIAAALGYDLYRVDLSTVISKYVGETAENLERILSEARHMNVVLLFDEADGLFAKRTDVSDAHDRYANTDTGHLLQSIEAYDGVAILASNRKRNMDEAFLRRLRYVLEFPAPDDAARLAVWRQVLGGLAGERAEALEPAIERIAGRVPLTGAQIKSAAVTSVFAAMRDQTALAPRHLLTGIDAELMKEGRALSTRELQALQGAP